MADTVVLFGGAGYLGSALLDELLDRGTHVIVADLVSDDIDIRAEFVKTDITDPQDVSRAIPKGAIVANFAGIADLNVAKELPRECIEVNVMGHQNILQASLVQGVQKVCYASSAYVYSQHGSFYRISKRTCEEYSLEYSKKYDLPYVILRYGSLYGGRSNHSNGMHRLVHQAMKESKLHYDGHPTDSREFIHVRDASDIAADVLLGDNNNEAFLLTGLERYSMAELFELIAEILNRPIDISFGCKDNSGHYKMTQYNFVPIEARRLSKSLNMDLGNGVMNLINSLHIKLLDQG